MWLQVFLASTGRLDILLTYEIWQQHIFTNGESQWLPFLCGPRTHMMQGWCYGAASNICSLGKRKKIWSTEMRFPGHVFSVSHQNTHTIWVHLFLATLLFHFVFFSRWMSWKIPYCCCSGISSVLLEPTSHLLPFSQFTCLICRVILGGFEKYGFLLNVMAMLGNTRAACRGTSKFVLAELDAKWRGFLNC